MSLLPHVSSDQLELIIAVLIVITLFNLIFMLTLLFASNSLNKKIKRWKAIHATADLDRVYQETLGAVSDLRHQMEHFSDRIDNMQEALRCKVSTPFMHRYNAFAEVGSDLSYSVALLDGNKNGVVLTSIYGRQESHTYGKPISQGMSTYPLTAEEDAVIHQTVQPVQNHVHTKIF